MHHLQSHKPVVHIPRSYETRKSPNSNTRIYILFPPTGSGLFSFTLEMKVIIPSPVVIIVTSGVLQLMEDTPLIQQNQSIFLAHALKHTKNTNTCKSSPLPTAKSHSSVSDSVVFVARLSGCVSALSRISRDGEKKGSASLA